MKYPSVVLGGTFDHIHAGHKMLLAKAFAVGKHVTIGLTTDVYITGKQKTEGRGQIQQYEERKNQLQTWLADHHLVHRTIIVPIDDMYGPTIQSETSFDAIIVSSDTRTNAEKINEKRTSLGLSPLAIIEIPLVPAIDAKPISSSRIRAGAIDMSGNLMLPDHLRELMREPLGEIVRDSDFISLVHNIQHSVLITVGDQTTKRFLDAGVVPDVAIIDRQVRRQPFDQIEPFFKTILKNAQKKYVQSGPGYISSSAYALVRDEVSTLRHHGENSSVIIVDGEEDLLVLPAVMFAPLRSIVYYGQPREGLVRIVVTDAVQKKAQNLLTQFQISKSKTF